MVKVNGTRQSKTNRKSSSKRNRKEKEEKTSNGTKDTIGANTKLASIEDLSVKEREKLNKLVDDSKEFQTVGEASMALSERDHGTHTIHDQAKESCKNIDKNFFEILEKHIALYDKDFFIIKFSRRDKLMWNVVDNRYNCHKDCPFPSFNQTVWRYYAATGEIEELWVLPSEFDCIEMEYNKDLTTPDEWPLLEYVIKFWNGSLKKLALQESASLNLKERW